MDPAPQTVSITVQVPVTDITAEGIERAVVALALAAVLNTKDVAYDEDGEPHARYDDALIKKMRGMVETALMERVTAVVDAQAPAIVADVLTQPFQPMTKWGERAGPVTSLREMIFNHGSRWLESDVDNDGREISGYHSGVRVKRLHWLVRSEVERIFKAELFEESKKVAAEIKPVIAKTFTTAVAETVNRMLGVTK